MTRNDQYPTPSPRPKPVLVHSQPDPDFGHDRATYEARLFNRCDHFNLVRYGAFGSEMMTTENFAVALYVATNNPRTLIYAVDSRSGDAFCIGKADYGKYAEAWLGRRKG